MSITIVIDWGLVQWFLHLLRDPHMLASSPLHGIPVIRFKFCGSCITYWHCEMAQWPITILRWTWLFSANCLWMCELDNYTMYHTVYTVHQAETTIIGLRQDPCTWSHSVRWYQGWRWDTEIFLEKRHYLNRVCLIEEKDFILVIQTPLQAAMLKEFGNNIILIDSTHGTTGYDFQLITIVVVDELGEGYPTAWCLSNREDQIVLTHFLTSLHSKSGTISPSQQPS